MADVFRSFVLGVLVVQWHWPQTSHVAPGGRMWLATILACGVDGPGVEPDAIKQPDVMRAMIGSLVLDPDGHACRIAAVIFEEGNSRVVGGRIGVIVETL